MGKHGIAPFSRCAASIASTRRRLRASLLGDAHMPFPDGLEASWDAGEAVACRKRGGDTGVGSHGDETAAGDRLAATGDFPPRLHVSPLFSAIDPTRKCEIRMQSGWSQVCRTTVPGGACTNHRARRTGRVRPFDDGHDSILARALTSKYPFESLPKYSAESRAPSES